MPRKTKQLGDVRWEQAKSVYRRMALAREAGDLSAMADELNALGRMFDVEGAGRPHLDFDEREFEKLCGLQCSLTEIAEFMGMSEDTVERRCKTVYNKNFADVFAQKRQTGLVGLRRTQFAMAKDSPAMAIFLGKNYLKQSDKIT